MEQAAKATHTACLSICDRVLEVAWEDMSLFTELDECFVGKLSQAYTDDAWACLVQQIRSNVTFSQYFLHADQDLTEGFTLQEFAALQTAYTNCGECQLVSEFTDSIKEAAKTADPPSCDRFSHVDCADDEREWRSTLGLRLRCSQFDQGWMQAKKSHRCCRENDFELSFIA